MGKASSNKKVARAAGIGGSHRTRATPWSYYGVLLVIVVLGVYGILDSKHLRAAKLNSQGGTPPTVGTTWHEGFAVEACGKLLPEFSSTKDPYGITTRGGGVITIAPTVKSAAGANATLGKFATSVGMELNAGAVQVPGGKLYRDGDSCGGQPGHVYVMTWTYANEAQNLGQLANVSPDGVKLADQQLVTIAFVPSSDKKKILKPPASVIDALNKASAQTTTTAPATSTTTVAGSSTTTPGGSTTSVPATSTTATTKPAVTTTTVPASTSTTKSK